MRQTGNPKKSSIKAIIFDLGGILVSNTDAQLYAGLARFFGVSQKKIKTILSKMLRPYVEGKITSRQFFNMLCSQFKTRKDFGEYYRLIRSSYTRHSKINPKIAGLIQDLRKKYKVYALTNTIDIHYEYNRQRKLFDIFAKAFCSNKMGMAKPAVTSVDMKGSKKFTKIYKHVIRKIKLEPEYCIFIDDVKENLVPASMIGMMTIRYRNVIQLKKDLEKLGIRY